jgi:hypothetical protein
MARIHSTITFDTLIEAVESGEDMGFCIACGAEHYGIEPDARQYECEACDLNKVYGAEELLMVLHPTAQV